MSSMEGLTTYLPFGTLMEYTLETLIILSLAIVHVLNTLLNILGEYIVEVLLILP